MEGVRGVHELESVVEACGEMGRVDWKEGMGVVDVEDERGGV